MHPQLSSSNNPAVDVRILSVNRVVIGDVLEVPRNCIETKSSVGRHITESHTACGTKQSTRWWAIYWLTNHDHRTDASDQRD